MMRVFILGIDGVPCTLLKEFMDEGIMPNLSRIVKDGSLLEMEASIPEVSSTSWASFMTGVNPGRHGIYGFMELDRESYRYRFPNSTDIKSDALWGILSAKGKRSIVLNIPGTYPARPLNGILTAGFVALDLKKATYPEMAYQYLQSIGYRMDVEAEKAKYNPDAFWEDVGITFAKRREAFFHFLGKEWDLFIATITETDRVHHFFWSAVEDENHPFHNAFIGFYRELDRLIGDLYDKVKNDAAFIIVSDHGFTGIEREVYLNNWLRERGYLKFNKDNPASFEDIHPESVAFALDPSRIYIHLKGKYPKGNVDPMDYHDLRERLKEDLTNLEIEGKKVIKRVFSKEEIYHGPYFEDAPDLVLLSKEGYDLKGGLQRQGIYGNGPFTGMHTRHNATFFINRKIEPQTPNIIDITPTVLGIMKVDTPDLDGIDLLK